MGTMTEVIRIDGLSVDFGGYKALDDVSLSVDAGESFGLVGESGSGKSTLLRAIAGLAPVSTGIITIEGARLAGNRRSRDFYRRVQMVFQDPYGSLHPRQTVDRQLLEPLVIHGIGDQERRIQTALDEVGLGAGFRFRYPHQLSGGQRQRVAIARALIVRPELLLTDEPTGNLDPTLARRLLRLFVELHKTGTSVVIATHDLALMDQYDSARRLVLADGRLHVLE